MSADLALAIAPDVTAIVRPASLVLSDVTVSADVEGLATALDHAAERGRTSIEAEGVTAAVRAMYKAVGLDPTKVRPSSEALLRRVRRGEPLPRINAAVDVVNWCSMESQLPFGLYDADRIHGAVVLRLGRDGEAYAGIRKDSVHVAGRLTLADDQGAFGNPTSDSARTMVTGRTTRLFVVIFAPAALPVARVADTLATTRVRLERYCGPSNR